MATGRWNEGRTFLLVTGASRGIGRAIAVAMAKELHPHSTIGLTARSQAGLEETATIVKSVASPAVRVICCVADLQQSDKELFEDMLKEIVGDSKPEDYDTSIIVHNAATFGRVARVRDHNDKQEMVDYLTINLISTLILNSVFMAAFCPPQSASLGHQQRRKRTTVINITSIAGVKVFKTCSRYGSTKATREFAFKSMAQEEEGEWPGRVKVLSYDPGLVRTDMMTELLADPGLDAETKEWLDQAEKNTGYMEPEQPAKKLVEILNGDRFETGARVGVLE